MQPLPTIMLDKVKYKESDVLSIAQTERNKLVEDTIRYELKARWSFSRRFWHLPYSIENSALVQTVLSRYAIIDRSLLEPKEKRMRHNLYNVSLTEAAGLDLKRFRKWLETHRYSASTVNTYCGIVEFFLKYIQKRQITELGARCVEQFNYEFIVSPDKSISYQNQAINAIKQYLVYKNVGVNIADIERPRREKKLPVVLSMEEVGRILDATNSIKHKAILSLIYSGGFRISEVLNLKLADIDSNRMLIHIHAAKGKKDRYTLLSDKALQLLREYYAVYKPKTFLFEGPSGAQYSQRAAQSVLQGAVARAGILKKVTLHTLRHSFATHLLEHGTDIRYIQNLLGHSNPKTTMIYTHVTDMSVQKIRNPLDMI